MNELTTTQWGYALGRSSLDNGLRLVRVRQPHLHRVSLAIFFQTGSRFETPKDNGLSHFLEHMLFRGTVSCPTSYELNLRAERLGGTLFAATAPDVTEYEITLPTQNLEQGLSLLADLVTEPLFKEIEIERRIIEEEILEDLDEDQKPIDIDFLSRRRLWPSHPLGQSVAGPLENARRFDTADVRGHFLRNYVARNAVLCVSGAFEPARVLDAAQGAFARLPAQPWSPGVTAEVPRGLGPALAHAHRPGSQTQLRFAFHTPGDDADSRIALSMLLSLLDDGMSTRLHRRIFDELGLAYHVGADLDAYRDVSALNIDVTTSHNNVTAVSQAVGRLLAELRDASIEPEELGKAKARSIWALESFLDDPGAMSGWFGEQQLYRTPDTLEERAEKITMVDVEDVQRLARAVFRPQNLQITTVGVVSSRVQQKLADLVAQELT